MTAIQSKRFWLATLVVLSSTSLSCFFEAPQDSTLFSCDPEGSGKQCPDDYQCEADGCCHSEGSDPQKNWNDCALSNPENESSGQNGESSSDDQGSTGDADDEDGESESSSPETEESGGN